MSIKTKLLISFLALAFTLQSQNVVHVYKIADLLKRIDTTKTTMVINFWSTWCKPCVQELPSFDSLTAMQNTSKVLLVSLDFSEDLDTKVNPFLKKNKVMTECVLLDESNGNDYINKISENWSGSIPATLFVHRGKKIFIEKKLKLKDLLYYLNEVQKIN